MALVTFVDDSSPYLNAQNLNNNFNECYYDNKYSTNEVIIGHWTDDKPIYRKVYSINMTSTSYNTSVSSLNIDTIITVKGISQGNPYTENYYSSATDNLRTFITSDKKLYVSGGSTYPTTPYTIKVVLEYTKTTD
jgi:hypothetical protein